MNTQHIKPITDEIKRLRELSAAAAWDGDFAVADLVDREVAALKEREARGERFVVLF